MSLAESQVLIAADRFEEAARSVWRAIELDETGEHPSSVGLSVWGTSAMRTLGSFLC